MDETTTAPEKNDITFKDPACGMTVKADSPHRYSYRQAEYHFCSARCLAQYETAAEKFLARWALQDCNGIVRLKEVGMAKQLESAR